MSIKDSIQARIAELLNLGWHHRRARRKAERERYLKSRLRRVQPQPIPIEHQSSAARSRAGLSDAERQRLIDSKTHPTVMVTREKRIRSR